MTAAIDVRGLTKRFDGRTVVDDFAIRVEQGQIFGFLGPNGSGKTTTIRMLCGLLTPDAGAGTCLGYDIRTEAQSIKREVGYMTQRFSLYEDLSLQENLNFFARMYAVPQRQQQVTAALDRLGLTARRRQLAGTLSGGWKQRLALAACLIHAPKLLLLDEPTAGVDPKARRDFWDQIHELAADGTTVLVSTHSMDEAERCHRLAYLAYGRLLVEGAADQVIAQSGLTTWLITARPDSTTHSLVSLAHTLRTTPGIDTLVPFGLTLHVSGRDAQAIERALMSVGALTYFECRPISPSLEDVFINLMQDAKDNVQ